jgi:hypothetical protein
VDGRKRRGIITEDNEPERRSGEEMQDVGCASLIPASELEAAGNDFVIKRTLKELFKNCQSHMVRQFQNKCGATLDLEPKICIYWCSCK